MENQNTAASQDPTPETIQAAIEAEFASNGLEPDEVSYQEKGRGVYLVNVKYADSEYAEHGVMTRARLGI